jgi:hypothetical protein
MSTLTYVPGVRCADCGLRLRYATDYYVLHNRVWNKAMTGRATGKNNNLCDGVDGMLHIACVEKRLGRELRQRDFARVPLNAGIFGFNVRAFEP